MTNQTVKENQISTDELAIIINENFNRMQKQMDGMQGEIGEIKTTMATKDDLGKLKFEILDAVDDKIMNLKGDLVILMRKEDEKLVSLINILHKKSVIDDKEIKELLSADPFPQLRYRHSAG